jgi:hypothetical protein
MEINKNLIDTIEIFVDKCDNFDKLYKKVIKIINTEINDNLDELYDITSNYIEIRGCHGRIIKTYDNYKNSGLKNDEEMYNLSALTSILENVNNIIQNVDFQYKQFATYFPNLVNKSYLTVLLIVDNNETEEDIRLINMLNEIKVKKYEHKYKIMKCGKKEGIELKIRKKNKKIRLVPKKTPSLYLINDDIISEIQTENIKNKEMLEKILIR